MFQELFNLLHEGQMLNMNLMKKGDKLIVCVLPIASDNVGADLSSLSITAAPVELETGFIQAIRTPIQDRCTALSDLEEFQKSTQNAKEKTKKPSTDTPKATVSAKPSKADTMIAEAEKMESAGNLPGAYAIYKKLYEQDKTNTKIGNKMHEVWEKMSQGSLFSNNGAETLEVVNDTQSHSEIEESKVETPIQQVEDSKVVDVSTATINSFVTPTPLTEEKEEESVDMFAQLLSGSKPDTETVAQQPKEVGQQESVPQIDPDQWRKFQEFQLMQQQQEHKSQGVGIGV